ncbi:hypothetical protein Tco_0396985 [Tanacetum coccineum]
MLSAPWPTCDQKFKAGIVNPDRSTYNIRAYPYKATIWIAYNLKTLVSKSKASNVFKTHGSIYSSSASKVKSALAGKLKSVKIEDDPPLAIVMKCDIRKPIWYLDSGCSRYMTGVKSYLHKYVEQPGPKVVFGDDSTCTTKGYGSIKCNGIVFTKVAFVNGLKYNLISISQLCDAKYIVQFDEKR